MNRKLAQAFPDAHCELDFTTPLELAVATILSAQSTDKRVNLTTPALFLRYRTALDYAQADREELETLIRPTGFYRNKASSLIGLGQALIERFDGELPNTMGELVTLPGVGRKTANVILGNAFGVPGITVDTHFGRLVRRWGWTTEEDPVKVEHAIGELIERKEWTLLSHRVIFHGRRVCHARKPACGVCVLAKDCPSFGTGPTEPGIAAALVQGPEGEHLPAVAGAWRRRCVGIALITFSSRATRWTVAILVVVVALLVALLVELRDGSRSSTPPSAASAREHREADSAAALAGPRRRAELAPCPHPDGRPGGSALRDVAAECAADVDHRAVGPALAGHRIVLNLWAYWCAPCATEL